MTYDIFKSVAPAMPRPGKRHKMHQITPLTGLKRHARTPCSDVFPNVCDIFSASEK